MNSEKRRQEIAKRVAALKQLSLEEDRIYAKINEKMFHINQRYMRDVHQLYDKRKDIISGLHQPAVSEYAEYRDMLDDLTETLKNQLTFQPNTPERGEKIQQREGIPNFWSVALSELRGLPEMINPIVLKIMSYCVDVRSFYITPQHPHPRYPQFQDMGYILELEFDFESNPYFSNPTLYNYVAVTFGDDHGCASDFCGKPLYCKGCEISWKIDVLQSMKGQLSADNSNTNSQYLLRDDLKFFDLFTSSCEPNTSEDPDTEEYEKMLESLDEHYIDIMVMVEDFIPNATSFFVGEMEEGDDISETDMEDEDDCDGYSDIEEEEDSDDEEEEIQRTNKKGPQSSKTIPRPPYAALAGGKLGFAPASSMISGGTSVNNQKMKHHKYEKFKK